MSIEDPYPDRDDAVALAEEFIDALYAFDRDAMLAITVPRRTNIEETLLFHQGWAEGADYTLTDREPCEFREGGAYGTVVCHITAKHDLLEAVGLPDEAVPHEITVYHKDGWVTGIEIIADHPPVLDAAIAWAMDTHPELTGFSGPCWEIEYLHVAVPQTCAIAVTEAIRGYPGT